MAIPLSSLNNDRICMMTIIVRLSRIPAGRGSFLCELGPIYIVSFYLIIRHNSLIITKGGFKVPPHQYIYETSSLEGLPTKAKEELSLHEMRLSPNGHQPSISWSQVILIFGCDVDPFRTSVSIYFNDAQW